MSKNPNPLWTLTMLLQLEGKKMPEGGYWPISGTVPTVWVLCWSV